MSYLQRSKLLKSLCQWKTKAITRRQENVALKKRLVELTQSRDAWKEKAQAHQRLFVTRQTEHQQAAARAPEKKKHALSL